MDENMNPMPQASMATPQEKEPKGPVVGIIVIIILLVVGGVYIFMNKRAEAPATNIDSPVNTELGPESTSTDLSAVESELNATNLNNLDIDLNQINTELNTPIQ